MTSIEVQMGYIVAPIVSIQIKSWLIFLVILEEVVMGDIKVQASMMYTKLQMDCIVAPIVSIQIKRWII